jgi:rhamnose utilization protein RhaD (predicted bifunctional aldolase and dehydrogenase)/NAD(P)-dependent dehydrogenase (short-subunit alcohol dehydrogenase family)
MENNWRDEGAQYYIEQYGKEFGEDLALRTYTSRLLGEDESLVLHGGGNTSVKGTFTNIFGESVPAVFVKASGVELELIEPDLHVALDLDYLRKFRNLPALDDDKLAKAFRQAAFSDTLPPSVEALCHAFLPAKYIDHTHADAILILTNQVNGEKHVRAALGDDVIILPYTKPGFGLAKAVAQAFDANPKARAMVWMHHGIITWGETARKSYELMLDLVARAWDYIGKQTAKKPDYELLTCTQLADARRLASKVAPILRGLLATTSGDEDRPFRRVILQFSEFYLQNTADTPVVNRQLALTPPLTSDHIIRTKPLPMWVDTPDYEDFDKLREQLKAAIEQYADDYNAYLARNTERLPADIKPDDPLPRVIILPGLGIIGAGATTYDAEIACDIANHTIRGKNLIAAMGEYQGLSEEHIFDMEYWPLQRRKLSLYRQSESPLTHSVALVTGAAGAIGYGICRKLLEAGCHVVAADISQQNLLEMRHEFAPIAEGRFIGIEMDVTDPESVANGFGIVSRTWGGIDLVVLNAGIALVSPLAEMDPEAFRRLERVNIEGTLLVLSEAARHFKIQGTGGDIILVSTKNVFAPGAKFGAYSATKAAAHQLARIASLEMADMGVRVNMVAPDAVFSGGKRKSGLWAEVGPDRMKARGLDEAGLEEYYRSRNLLKARVTAEHVGNAVLYFATRQTPTTGATIPVDGGLPDATPR